MLKDEIIEAFAEWGEGRSELHMNLDRTHTHTHTQHYIDLWFCLLFAKRCLTIFHCVTILKRMKNAGFMLFFVTSGNFQVIPSATCM
jgi:hypothetical protein